MHHMHGIANRHVLCSMFTCIFSAVNVRSQAVWPPASDAELPRATFALGCFWGPQLVFERVPGVVSTAVGYTGGKVDNPGYNAVRRFRQPPRSTHTARNVVNLVKHATAAQAPPLVCNPHTQTDSESASDCASLA